MSAKTRKTLRPRQKLGKYRILRTLNDGQFAAVYAAQDQIEGCQVALKIPHAHLLDDDLLAEFRREARITARLDHPHILPVKNADFVDDQFVIAYRLGTRTLGDRLSHRLSVERVMVLASQMLEAMAHAHHRRVLHGDLKPENIILFPDDVLRVTDFGIARVMKRTIHDASGSGTVGYVAPEQAMGHPSLRSDVFSLGLILYRMLAGELPRWPYAWPPVGIAKVRRKVPALFVDFLQRSLEVDHRRRYVDARTMRDRFLQLQPAVLSFTQRQRARRRRNGR